MMNRLNKAVTVRDRQQDLAEDPEARPFYGSRRLLLEPVIQEYADLSTQLGNISFLCEDSGNSLPIHCKS